MAFSTQTDYTAQNAALAKQLAAATDAATKAALQAQIDANSQSKLEKSASDLTTYGKYLSDSELNGAAGIMAQNQIGTGYEIQKTNLNTSYDTAKQNASNDANSRGMARSSFVGDRMANLDVQRANALTQVDASKALALRNAQTNIIDNFRANSANTLANEKTDYNNNQMTHYQDYQAEINNVLNDGDPTNNWKADKLLGWRNEKLLAQEAAALKAAQAAAKGSGYGNGNGNGTEKPKLTAAQALAAYDDDIKTPEVIAAYTYYYGDPDYDPNKTPEYSTPRTATYGSSTIGEVNDKLNNGYTPQEVIDAARQKYGANSKEYQSIVSAALRQR